MKVPLDGGENRVSLGDINTTNFKEHQTHTHHSKSAFEIFILQPRREQGALRQLECCRAVIGLMLEQPSDNCTMILMPSRRGGGKTHSRVAVRGVVPIRVGNRYRVSAGPQ